MEKSVVTKLGIGVVMIGVFAYTLDFILKQVRKLVNTTFDFSGVRINSLQLDKVSITLFWKVVNKSDISATISNQDFDIYLNGRFIKKVGYANPVEIKANKTTYLPTYVVFNADDLKKIGIGDAGLLLTKEGRKRLNLLVKGTFTVKTSIFEVKKFPFEFEDTIQNIYNY